jgi:hypothetical protein
VLDNKESAHVLNVTREDTESRDIFEQFAIAWLLLKLTVLYES